MSALKGESSPACQSKATGTRCPACAALSSGPPLHEGKGGRKWIARAGDYTGALGHTRRDAVASPAIGVRRLTPVECERLQGFPDGWTDVPWGGKPNASDSRRYAALGDAVTVPVAEWLGRRLIGAMAMDEAA